MRNKTLQNIKTPAISLADRRRRDLKLTLAEMEARSGLSRSSISTIERGMKPTESTAALLAEAYGLTLDGFWRLFRRETK